MDDLISRQAAIELIERMKPFHQDADDIIEMIDNMPSVDVQPVQQWILCSERLPEEDGQYLITVKYKHVNDSYEDVYAEHGEWYNGRFN